MVLIISDKGYPGENHVLARVDYFWKVPSSFFEGGILIIGKDGQGKEYKPKNEPTIKHSYATPSKAIYHVPVGDCPERNHPAIYFPFGLTFNRSGAEFDTIWDFVFDDIFLKKFDITLMDENKSMKRILLAPEIERIFKEITIWGHLEVGRSQENHFCGEKYYQRTPALEEFLENHRG